MHKKDTLLGASFNGADDQIRTDYLVLTKDALYLLSYISKNGRGRRIRTLGTWFWRPLLYQLSYTPKNIKLVGHQGLEPRTDRL